MPRNNLNQLFNNEQKLGMRSLNDVLRKRLNCKCVPRRLETLVSSLGFFYRVI